MNTYIENYERVLGQQGEFSGSQVTFSCPFPGCAGYNKKRFYVDPERGLWCCHHCCQTVGERDSSGGNALEFARLMGDDPGRWPTGTIDVALPKIEPLTESRRKQLWTAMFDACSLSELHRELLRERGIDGDRAGYVSATAEMFQKLGGQFGEETMVRGGLAYLADYGEGALHPRQCVQPGRILIPYREKGQVVYFVGYARRPEQQPDQTAEQYKELYHRWAKTAGPAGYTPKVYGLAPAEAEYVIVTEGQLKAEAARQRGFPCIGISGIGNSHKLVAKHCSKQQVKRVIILFDTQLEDQETVDHEAMRLAKELLKAGISTFHAELQLEEGAEKVDIDSYLLTHTTSQFAAVLCEAGRRPYELEVDAPVEEESHDETTAESDVALG